MPGHPKPIPAGVVAAVVFPHRVLGGLKRVVWGVERRVKEEGFVPARGFFKELQSEVDDGMRRVEWAAIEGLGDLPFLAVEAEGVVAGKVVRGPRKMSPIALEPEVGGLFAEVPLADHGGEVTRTGKHFRDGGAATEARAAGLVTVESGQQRHARGVALGRVVELSEA